MPNAGDPLDLYFTSFVHCYVSGYWELLLRILLYLLEWYIPFLEEEVVGAVIASPRM